MTYSIKLQKAITLASYAHQGQTRKGKEIPYIIHPLTVGLILTKIGASEDVIIAGILHDTIEDTQITKQDLENEFGTSVARIVNDVTEQDKSLTWEERKRAALEHIKHTQQDSLLVKSADVLHNMTELISDYQTEGEKVFIRFNAPKEKQIDRYVNIVKTLEKAWSDNPLMVDLKENIAKLEVLLYGRRT